MRQLESHTIERSVITEKNSISIDFLDTIFEQLDERPDVLPTVFRRQLQLAAGLFATGAPTQGIASLRRAARVVTLYFVHARDPEDAIAFALDDQHRVTLSGDIDESAVHAPAWIEGMWCALAAGDDLSQHWLATVPVSDLRAPGVQHARFAFAMGEFLRSLVSKDGRHGQWLGDALEQCNDNADMVLAANRDWVDAIDFPALRAAYHALDRDAIGFNNALAELLQEHRRYWSQAEYRLAVDGLLSVRACALCRLAAGLGVAVDISSAYMPPAVWQA